MALTTLFVYSLFFGLFIGALKRPIFGVLGYIAVYLIWNPNIWWGESFSQYLPRPSFTAIIFLIIGALISIKKLNWSFSRREVEFYLFLGLIWLSSIVFGIGMLDNNWFYLMKMTKLFVFIFLFIRVVHSLDDYKLVVWTFIICTLFLAYQGHIVSYRFFSDGRLNTFGGFDFNEANGFAALLSIAMIFLAIDMIRVVWWKKLIYICGIGLFIDTIILTRSRGVFLGLLMAIPYILVRSPSENRKQVYSFMILGIILFFMLTDLSFIDRMKTIPFEIESNQEEVLTRLDFWKASLAMFKDYPLGVGIKNFENLVPSYDSRNPGKDAHNTFVLCYSEIGIFGIVLFLIIIIETFLQLRRIRLILMNTIFEKDIILYAFALGIVFILYLAGYMMTHSNLYTEILWILLAMPICLENATQQLLSKLENGEFS
jgi:O-antigen ligase